MGKLRSNRVKRLPQTGITSDRYEFLGLNQAEPNLGDPKVGPSSVGVNPIKAGAFYQLAAIGEYPGERYWSTQVGIGSTLGVISVYANDLLPSSAFERIHGLNFVGTGVTLETPPLELFDGIGIATIRFTVTDILNQGPEGQVLYNGPGGLVDDADNLYYVAGNVGIGSTIPQYPLDVASNVRLQSGLYAGGSIGVAGQYLSATGTGITWSTFPILRTGLSTIATVGQTGFTTSYNVGFLDVFVNGVRLTGSEYVANNGSTITLNAPCFGGEAVDILAYGVISTASGIGGIGVGGSGGGPSYWIQNNTGINTSSNVGIGTTNAIEALTVSGNVSVTGVITASYFYGDGSNLTNLPVGGGSDSYWVKNITGIHTTSNVGVGTTTPNSKLTVEGDAYISGIVTALDFDSFSDINLKENIQTIKNPLDKVVKITGVTFNWKASGSPSVGVIAQDVEEVFPELVSGTDIKSLNYNGLVGLLIETIKEQQIQIDSLKNDVDELKSK